MKIQNVTSTLVHVPMRKPARWATGGLSHVGELYVQVETDEGPSGLGFSYNHPETVAIIEQRLLPTVLGRDPFDTEGIWADMYDAVHTLGHQGLVFNAMAAIDIALWDLKARALGLPLYKLLGACRESVPVYGSGGFLNYSVDELVEEATGFVERGIPRVKMKIGLDAGRDDREDVRRVAAVRKAVGDDVEIYVDANGSYRAKQAVDVARRLEDLRVGWLEEPVHAADREGLAVVARGTTIPLATGEFEYHLFAFRSLMAAGAVDIVQADVGRVGGVTPWLKIAKLAEAFNLPVAPHAFDVVHLHLMCAVPNATVLEHLSIYDDLPYKERPEPRDGILTVPADRPGHGLELDAERVAANLM